MKLNSKLVFLILALGAGTSGIALAAVASAPTMATVTSAPGDPATAQDGNMAAVHMGHHRGGLLVGVTLHAIRQLNLTADQQSQIKSLLSAARSRNQSSRTPPDMAVLGNPGDPNYAAAVEAAKSRAAARLQQQIELQGQIYNVLTSEQKAQLPQVLATMKARAESRRALWQQKHAGGVGAAAAPPSAVESRGDEGE